MKSRSTYVVAGFAALFVLTVVMLGNRTGSAEQISRVEDGLAGLTGEYSIKYDSKTGLAPGPDHIKGSLRGRDGEVLNFCVVARDSDGSLPPPDRCAALNAWNWCGGLEYYVGARRKPPSPVSATWRSREKMANRLESIVIPGPCGVE